MDTVDIEIFRRFTKKHPALLFPAFEMQRKMQEYTLGKGFWKRLGDRRLRLSSGQFVPVKRFMDMHLAIIANDKRGALPASASVPSVSSVVRVAPSQSRTCVIPTLLTSYCESIALMPGLFVYLLYISSHNRGANMKKLQAVVVVQQQQQRNRKKSGAQSAADSQAQEVAAQLAFVQHAINHPSHDAARAGNFALAAAGLQEDAMDPSDTSSSQGSRRSRSSISAAQQQQQQMQQSAYGANTNYTESSLGAYQDAAGYYDSTAPVPQYQTSPRAQDGTHGNNNNSYARAKNFASRGTKKVAPEWPEEAAQTGRTMLLLNIYIDVALHI